MYAKWVHNEDQSIDEENFVGFCKQELDGGKARMVVLKFMRDEEKFYNEITPRHEAQLHSSNVMTVLNRYDARIDEQYKKDLVKQTTALSTPEDFKFALVMPKGDSNLDSIFRQERPSVENTRHLMHEVALCLKHIHSKSVIHGDLKMLNVIRFKNRLRLIDLDSAIILGDTRDVQYFGVPNSFSSGLVPPECVFALKAEKEVEQFEAYWAGYGGDKGGPPTVERCGMHGESVYCLKGCNDKRIEAKVSLGEMGVTLNLPTNVQTHKHTNHTRTHARTFPRTRQSSLPTSSFRSTLRLTSGLLLI